jgi:hypothetical protein
MEGFAVDFISEERGTRASDWISAVRASTGPSSLETSADGSVILSGVPNGDYNLQCVLPSGGLFEQIVRVPVLAEGSVVIELP